MAQHSQKLMAHEEIASDTTEAAGGRVCGRDDKITGPAHCAQVHTNPFPQLPEGPLVEGGKNIPLVCCIPVL